MLPSSWKAEIENAVDQAEHSQSEEWEAKQRDAGSQTASAIAGIKSQFEAGANQRRRNDYVKKWTDGLTLVFVFLTAIFTGLSWWVFRGQLNEMKATSAQTDQIIENNRKLADAATNQADAAIETVKTARDSLIVNQRAWVGPRNARSEGKPEVAKELTVFVDYQNTGREPAIETIYDLDVFVADEQEDHTGMMANKVIAFINKCKMSWKPTQATVVFPTNSGFGTGYAVSKKFEADIIDQDVIDSKKLLIVDGCFVYKTAGGIHRSSFCYFFKADQSKPANWNICNVGNGAD